MGSSSLPKSFSAGDTWAERKRLDGSRTVWLAGGQLASDVPTRWDATAEGEWEQTAEQDQADWLTLRADEVTWFHTPEPTALLASFVLGGDDSSPEDVEWEVDVDEFEDDEDFYLDDGQVSRYSRVNGDRVRFASSDSAPVPYTTRAGEVAGDSLADFSWGSEAGMTSGAGGWCLYEVAPGLAVAEPRGDTVEWAEGVWGFHFASDRSDLATLLAGWTSHISDSCAGVYGAAALELEPFEPQETLEPRRRESWVAALESLNSGFGGSLRFVVYVDDHGVRQALRDLLTTEETYRNTRDAVAAPNGAAWLLLSVGKQ